MITITLPLIGLALCGMQEWEAETYKKNETGEIYASQEGATVQEVAKDGVRSISENGLLKVKDAVGDANSCKALGDLIDRLQPRMEPKHANHHHNIAVELLPEVRDVVYRVIERNYNFLSSLLTEDAGLVELAMMVNDPGAAYQKWHADTVASPKVAKLFSFFIALDEISLDMGPTALVPRTHTQDFIDICNKEVTRTKKAVCAESFAPLSKIGATMSPGDMTVMDSTLQHRANENYSSRRRRIVYFSLAGPGVKPDGSTYTLLPGYSGHILKEYKTWHTADARLGGGGEEF
eukprot:TRINITY_DN3476_c1_g1_i1.p1 TRINITY_DN3476_c1_g1~~TRINITY_DN3476_c1_g1_i1.p1  ORF type:complete len:308 (+),score=59.04 TRINITY_DN3476_c1_g1_i1:49-924(+)